MLLQELRYEVTGPLHQRFRNTRPSNRNKALVACMFLPSA